MKNDKKFNLNMDILSSESDPSEGSTVDSDVATDPDDPFSQTQEGKEIMKKMKKIKPDRKSGGAEEKRKTKESSTIGSGFRPYLDVINPANRPAPEFCAIAQAQADSREHTRWIGEVKDIDALWMRDICDANLKERRSGGAMK